MTKEERTLVDEIRVEIKSLLAQYAVMVDTREMILAELKQVKAENESLKKIVAINGRCYFEKGGPILPFKWRS